MAKEVPGGPILYREWGYRFTVLENYSAAIKAFEKCLACAGNALAEEDLRSLLGLSVALSRASKYDDASKVIDRCMKIAPENFRVKWRRVETLFATGEFGYSLIHAHQGMRHHIFPFTWGVCQGNETVEECIGRNTSPVVLRLLYPWIQDVQKRQAELLAKLGEEEDEFEGIDEEREEGEEDSRFRVNNQDLRLELYLKQLHRVMAELYLGLMAYDKHFMERLMESPEVRSANVAGSRKINELAEMSYRNSCYRQNILRMRRPFYAFAFVRGARSPGDKKRLRRDKRMRGYSVLVEARHLLDGIDEARARRDYARLFDLVDRAKDKLESYPEKKFPWKRKCLDEIYRTVGWAHIEARDLTRLDGEERKTRHLRHHLGMRAGKLPRDAELAWVPTLNRKSALRSFRGRFAMASEPLELAWLFHGLSKFLAEVRRYDLARFYAKKARDISSVAGIDNWGLNANHALVRIELSQRNRNEAREAAQVALEIAKRMRVHFLIDFYGRAIRFIDSVEFDPIDGIAKRERLILDLMPNGELRTELDFLLRSIDVLPVERRLLIMPGCKPVERPGAKITARSKDHSAPIDREKEARKALFEKFAPKNIILGWMDFDDYE